MSSRFHFLLFATLAAACHSSSPPAREPAQSAPVSPVLADPPDDAAHPPRIEPVRIPSGDAEMNGVLYLAAGANPHPTMLLLHGFPGNEQNLDLAQALRRAGWNVLTFHYRGSWGSPGAFSFANALEDTRAALAFLRAAPSVANYAIDPERLSIMGHSMGGLMAAKIAANDPLLRHVVLIAPWDAGQDAEKWASFDAAARQKLYRDLRADILPLAGCTPESLVEDAIAHRDDWKLIKMRPAHPAEPVLVITADDGLAPPAEAYADAIGNGGMRLTRIHIATDHAFSGKRVTLALAIMNWLAAAR